MAPLAGPSGTGANAPSPQPAAQTRLYDVMRRWSAAVEVDGKETEIFKVEHEVGQTTCYIAAAEGKEFEVAVRQEPTPTTDEVVWNVVDGKQVDGIAWRLDKLGATLFSGSRIGPDEIRPFLFAPLALTDDPDSAVQDESVIKGLGTIRLDFYRTVHHGTHDHDVRWREPAEKLVVDERNKKATMSHSTAYGPPKKTARAGKAARVDYTDPFGHPQYSLIFKYRSRAILEAEGIAETLDEAEPVQPEQERGSSPSGSPAPGPAPHARSSSTAAGRKRKKIELTLPESDSDDDADGGDLRAKIARLEAENAKLRGNEKVKVKVTTENGKVVLDLLDE
ncbi:hypothetical protein JCM3774_006626 [Rhodotorula dairenensis]